MLGGMSKTKSRRNRDGINISDTWAIKGKREGQRWLYRVRDPSVRRYIAKAFSSDDEADKHRKLAGCAEGDRWAAETKAKFTLGQDSAGRAMVDEVAADYLQALRDKEPKVGAATIARVEAVVAELKEARIRDMRSPGFPGQVEHYLRTLKVSKSKGGLGKLAPSTKEKRLSAIKALVNHAIKRKRMVQNPLMGYNPYRAGDGPREILTITELRAVLALDRPSDPVWLKAALCAYLGTRRAEAEALIWERDINWDARLVKVRDGKGHKSRSIPMMDEIYELLSELGGPDAKVARTGRIIAGLPSDRAAVWAAFRKLLQEVEIDPERGINPATGMPARLSWHSLRHTFAALHLATGTDSLFLRFSLGHSKPKQTQHYAQQANEYKHQVEREGWKAGQFCLMRPPPIKTKSHRGSGTSSGPK
jgi:integrase